MKAVLSPKELGDAIGLSESSLKRWADKGLLSVTRSVGGHRRIALAEAIRFIREMKYTVVRPAILGLAGLPITPPRGAGGISDADFLFGALRADQAVAARGAILSLYLSGVPIAAICDGPLKEAMTRIGELWCQSDAGIVMEHRATDICLQAFGQLRSFLPAPPEDAPVAIGGGVQGDPYLLPSLMAASVLAEAGYREHNLGPDTPLPAFLLAAEHYRPRLAWLACCHPPPGVTEEVILDYIERLATGLARTRTPLLVGGRGVPELPPAFASMGVHRAGSMSDLAVFAKRLAEPPGDPA